MVRVCFVCLGNICRSPTAEAVMEKMLNNAGLDDSVHVEGAGTGDWHVGEPPDRRSIAAARKRGYTIGGRAAHFDAPMFDRFDFVVAMDKSNREALHNLARNDEDRAKISLFRNWDPASPKDADVPDPYYGGGDGFKIVIDICEAGCTGLLEMLRSRVQ